MCRVGGGREGEREGWGGEWSRFKVEEGKRSKRRREEFCVWFVSPLIFVFPIFLVR